MYCVVGFTHRPKELRNEVHKKLCIFLTGGVYTPYSPCMSMPLARRESEVDHALLGGTHSGEISTVRKHHGTTSISRQQTEKSGRNGLSDVLVTRRSKA